MKNINNTPITRRNKASDPDVLASQLATITKVNASNFNFKNVSGDADLLVNVIQTATASTLYIDTNIYIDKPINVDFTNSKVKKIIGFGGVITFTNTGVSTVPSIQISNAKGLIISGLNIIGNINASLINQTDWSNNIVSPLYLYQCTNCIVEDNNIDTIRCDYAICVRYCTNVIVTRNTVMNCWNQNTGNTNGDAIYIGFGNRIKIVNNHLENDFSTTNGTDIGRIGVCFEFMSGSFHALGNYVYGYDRAFHVENTSAGRGEIGENIIEGCPMAYVGWHCYNHPVLFHHNSFTNAGVPTSYTSGMGQSWGVLTILSNTPTSEVNYNTVIESNLFVLDVNVTSMNYFVSTKITGETYYNNTFIDNNNNKMLFFYNPSDTGTINNNRFEFIGNKVNGMSVYFGHLGKHKINGNNFNLTKFTYICTPVPTVNALNREFIGNIIKNGDSGTVATDSYLFMNMVSMLCRDNVFKDILVYSGQQNTIVRANQDYTSTPELKSIFDNNTVISIQSGTVSTFFFGRMDNMIHSTITNKHITSSGMIYEQSGIKNSTLILTASDGSERTITVDTTGALTAPIQRWK